MMGILVTSVFIIVVVALMVHQKILVIVVLAKTTGLEIIVKSVTHLNCVMATVTQLIMTLVILVSATLIILAILVILAPLIVVVALMVHQKILVIVAIVKILGEVIIVKHALLSVHMVLQIQIVQNVSAQKTLDSTANYAINVIPLGWIAIATEDLPILLRTVGVTVRTCGVAQTAKNVIQQTVIQIGAFFNGTRKQVFVLASVEMDGKDQNVMNVVI